MGPSRVIGCVNQLSAHQRYRRPSRFGHGRRARLAPRARLTPVCGVESRTLTDGIERLRDVDTSFEVQAAAAARLVQAMLRGRQLPLDACSQLLTWVHRNRCRAEVIGVGRQLARLGVREVAELGVGIVRYARSPTEVALGRALFGL